MRTFVDKQRLISEIIDCAEHLRLNRSCMPAELYSVWKRIEDLTDGDSDSARFVLSQNEIKQLLPFLRREYAKMLFALETAWANTVLRHDDFTVYPKYTQYELRLAFEMSILRIISEKPIRHALLCGCGPLPVSAAILKSDYQISVDLLDKSTSALKLASMLMSKVPGPKGKGFQCDVEKFSDFAKYDVVFLAGTVGLSEVRKTQIGKIVVSRLGKGSSLVLRQPMNLDQLLVAKTDIAQIEAKDCVVTQFSSPEDCIERVFLRRERISDDSRKIVGRPTSNR